MGSKVLIVVDVQRDFCEGGAMGVDGGTDAAEVINDYLRSEFRDEYDKVIFSRDWHDPDTNNGGHFSDEPDFVNTWPAHCVRGTAGAEFHPSVAGLYRDAVVSKGMDEPAYSAFEGTVDDEGGTLHEYLQSHVITSVDVVGIAYDYCVKATAMDARKHGYSTRVLAEMTAAVNPMNIEPTEEMRVAGIEVSF